MGRMDRAVAGPRHPGPRRRDPRCPAPATAALAAGLLAGTLLAATPAHAGDELDHLVHWMTGSFSSAAQAEADSAYFDIRLHMAPIWPDDATGPWLYVEQAAATHPDAPYRQRVYRLARMGGTFTSEVWEMPEPLRFVGAWRDPSRLDSLAPDSLLLREGCTVALERAPDGAFVGGTVGTGCRSSLRGAAYATSEVRIDPDGIESWDRGFDPHGNQVWGATAGPYVFRRMAELAEEMPPLPPPPPAPRAPAPTSPAPKKGDG